MPLAGVEIDILVSTRDVIERLLLRMHLLQPALVILIIGNTLVAHQQVAVGIGEAR